jgi:hypothetical protein
MHFCKILQSAIRNIRRTPGPGCCDQTLKEKMPEVQTSGCSAPSGTSELQQLTYFLLGL